MKKNYYLLVLLAVTLAFSACDPLSNTYKELGPAPLKTVPAQAVTYTLTAADYQLLPGTVYASTSLSFLNTADANQYIPAILNSKYGSYPDGSTAGITFNIGTPAPSIALADSVYNTTATGCEYTLVNPTDYQLYSKNIDLSAAQALAWLPLKYTTPVANQFEVLTWIYYPTLSATAPQIYPGIVLSTSGTPAVTTATGSFLYLNGAWIQCYQITPAEYSAVGRGQYNQFTSTDDANLVSYLNGILKADASVTASAVLGSIQYVSFNYYQSATTAKDYKVTSQRVIALVFNGTNWSRSQAIATASATFTKVNGVWIGDPTVYYTVGGVGSADLALLANSGIGGSTLASDLASTVKYGDFDTYWVSLSPNKDNTWLNQAFILILTHDFPTPKVNTPYKVTFLYYTGGKDVSTTYSFTYSGTAWVAGQ